MKTVRWSLALLLFLGWSSPIQAQLHDHGSGLPHGVPDFCAADGGALMVLAGQTRTFSGPLTVSCLGVHGTATLEGAITATTVLVYDDGALTLADGTVLTIRDTPLNLTSDPEQFGNGLLGFGIIRALGQPKQPFVRLSQEVGVGTTTLMLSQSPLSWLAGDVLALPDTRQSRTGMSQSEEVTIAAIAGTAAMLVTPTRFSHLGARRPDGIMAFLPHVANLSRSIVVRSENPTGTRGHVLVSQRADVDLRYVEFSNLGRTRADPLDSTSFDTAGLVTHIGTNQVGRYPLHFHHVFGPAVVPPGVKQFIVLGASVHGFDKWGVAVHNSHFGLVQESVVWAGRGAGIVTEDGSETGNSFVGNFIGNVRNPNPVGFDGATESQTDPSFRLGNGYVFRAMNSEVRGSVVADVMEGMNFLSEADDGIGPTSGAVIVRVPRTPGVDTTVDANVTPTAIFMRPRLRIEDNEVYASDIGIGVWGQAPNAGPAVSPPFQRNIIWHITPPANTSDRAKNSSAVFCKYCDSTWIDLTLLNEGGVGRGYAQFNPAAEAGLGSVASELVRADVRGFEYAWARIGQIGQAMAWTVADSVFQNVVDFPVNNAGQNSSGALDINSRLEPFVWPFFIERPKFTWTNTQFLPMPGMPLRAIETKFYTAADNVDLKPYRYFELRVFGYQGVSGQDFRVYFNGQSEGEPVAPCQGMQLGVVGFTCPVSGAQAPVPTPVPAPTPSPTPVPQPTPIPTPAPPTLRALWTQVASDLATANGYAYVMTVDAVERLLSAACVRETSPFECSASISVLAPGTHTITLTAGYTLDGRLYRSDPSEPLVYVVPEPIVHLPPNAPVGVRVGVF